MSGLPDCRFPDVDFRPIECVGIAEGPPINLAELLPYAPGTLRIGKPRQEHDGIWTIPFEYQAEGWGDETGEAKP